MRIGAFDKFDGDPKSALPKYEEVPIENPYTMQLEVLGYVVPTMSLLTKIEELLAQPCRKDFERFAGFVTRIVDKESMKGAYRVYHLSPYGSFWMRPHTEGIKVGSFVSGSKSYYGNSNDVKIFRLKGRDS
jgi:hypothetical protein